MTRNSCRITIRTRFHQTPTHEWCNQPTNVVLDLSTTLAQLILFPTVLNVPRSVQRMKRRTIQDILPCLRELKLWSTACLEHSVTCSTAPARRCKALRHSSIATLTPSELQKSMRCPVSLGSRLHVRCACDQRLTTTRGRQHAGTSHHHGAPRTTHTMSFQASCCVFTTCSDLRRYLSIECDAVGDHRIVESQN